MGALAPLVALLAICGMRAGLAAAPSPAEGPIARVRGAANALRTEQARTRTPQATAPTLEASMLEEAAHARFLPSLLGGGKDAAPETEPLPDQSTLRAFVESNNAHEDRSTANTCSVCVSIATKHLAGSEDNGLYCLGSKNMGSQQVVSMLRCDAAACPGRRAQASPAGARRRGVLGANPCVPSRCVVCRALARSVCKPCWAFTGGSTPSRTGAPTAAE